MAMMGVKRSVSGEKFSLHHSAFLIRAQRATVLLGFLVDAVNNRYQKITHHPIRSEECRIMAMDICKNHPAQRAVTHCETCHIPLCEACIINSPDPKFAKKAFCCEDHRLKFESYGNSEAGKQIKKLRPPSIFTQIFKLLFIVVVLYVIIRFVKPDLIPAQFRFF